MELAAELGAVDELGVDLRYAAARYLVAAIGVLEQLREAGDEPDAASDAAEQTRYPLRPGVLRAREAYRVALVELGPHVTLAEAYAFGKANPKRFGSMPKSLDGFKRARSKYDGK